MPEDDLPDWAAQADANATSFRAPAPDPLAPAPVAETFAPVETLDATEPAPVQTIEPARTPTAGLMGAVPEPLVAPIDWETVCALGALILVGPAMVATLLPYGRLIGLALATVGFVVGLKGLGAEGRARAAGALGAALHFGALVVLLFLPSWLALDPWQTGSSEPEQSGPRAVENATGAPAAVAPTDWLDAANQSWQNGAVRVSLRSGVGPVELHGPKGAKRVTKESYLRLALLVRNIGFEKERALTDWGAGHGTEGVRVTDANGQPLALATFEAGWAPDHGKPTARAMPGHLSEVVLVFVAPPAKTDFVRVQLGGAAIGGPDEIRFRVGTTAPPARRPGR